MHERVAQYLLSLRDGICASFGAIDRPFASDAWQRPPSDKGLTGRGEVRMIEGGSVFERAGIAFSDVRGAALPKQASERNAAIAGKPFVALGVSLVFHPQNPYVPTTHMNVRYFATTSGQDDQWWFGGGFDLTPYYPFEEDARHWHAQAKDACAPFGQNVYGELKKACDDYFFLKHRNECRGIGGLFGDDLSGDFEQRFALIRSIGDHFVPAYLPIVQKRRDHAFGERQRDFQLYRRGRYVEFNLVFDRGTSFGLQSGGRTEAIMLSMPPLVKWRYDWQPEPGSEEASLAAYLQPRAW